MSASRTSSSVCTTNTGLRHRALWWWIGIAGVVGVVILSLVPSPPSLEIDASGWSDHIATYASLMAWFARLDAEPGVRRRIALALVLLGVVLECAQGVTAWRTFDPGDMLANAAGVAIGWIASPPRVPNGLPLIDRLLFGHKE